MMAGSCKRPIEVWRFRVGGKGHSRIATDRARDQREGRRSLSRTKNEGDLVVEDGFGNPSCLDLDCGTVVAVRVFRSSQTPARELAAVEIVSGSGEDKVVLSRMVRFT